MRFRENLLGQEALEMNEIADDTTQNKVALITGAAQRIGSEIARAVHKQAYNVIIHYGQSESAASALAAELNSIRPESAFCMRADLSNLEQITHLVKEATAHWGRLDLLVNNASRFYPTQLDSTELNRWEDLINTNLRAPYFLAKAARAALALNKGNIVNIVDIYAERPLKNHAVYSISKAGLAMLTKALAQELGPQVRVNGVSPGAILWPVLDQDDTSNQSGILSKTIMGTTGSPQDIGSAVVYLATQAPYVTGQILAVDGGRTLNQ